MDQVHSKTILRFIRIKKNNIIVKSGTELSHIVRNADNETHFKDVLDTKSMTVNPKTYSHFASWKLMSAVLVDDLTEIIKKSKLAIIQLLSHWANLNFSMQIARTVV